MHACDRITVQQNIVLESESINKNWSNNSISIMSKWQQRNNTCSALRLRSDDCNRML